MITDPGAKDSHKPYRHLHALIRVRVVTLLFVLLLALLPTPARAEIVGTIESVGFDQTFRPGCWTPLVVRLRPDAGSSGTYQIRVEQEDLDRDLISYVRTITLTAPTSAAGGAGADQRFTVYFLPQGARNRDGRGLPDKNQGASIAQLDSQLRVFLCTERGEKISRIPVGSMVASLEPIEARRSVKLVLFVRDANSSPARRDFSPQLSPLLGVTEDIAFVDVAPRALPTSVLGYEAVDAVVWAAGAPPDRAIASEEPRYRALRQWLGAGGRLVVMQHPEWRKTAAWGDLLPVTFPRYGDLQGVTQRADLDRLESLAAITSPDDRRLWSSLRGPHNYGIALLRPGAIFDAEDTVYWSSVTAPGVPTNTPWLARQPIGAGSVTYVAQDLGSPLLSPMLPPPGWPRIWCKVLDYNYFPLVVTKETEDAVKDPLLTSTVAHDLGRQVFNRMALTSRAGTLVSVAIIFFLLYWLAAGPGSWVLLRIRGKREYSWLAFAAIAGAATLATVFVVRIVLRGGPELRHFSLVRVIPNEPTLVQSRLGLYIPRDGNQDIALPPGAPDYSSNIAPYAIHPRHASDVDEFPSFRRYEVQVPDASGDTPASIAVPYRSTEKRIQLAWRGDLKSPKSSSSPESSIAITGQAAVSATSRTFLSGNLTNASGTDLRNVMLVFRSEVPLLPGLDRVIFIPSWKDGAQISLDDITNISALGKAKPLGGSTPKNDGSTWATDSGEVIYGFISRTANSQEWDAWFKQRVASSGTMLSDAAYDDHGQAAPRGYAFLSLFDRLPFFRNLGDKSQGATYTRTELHRLGARFLDVSPAISAGRLVILAQADNAPLPVPITVNGDAVPGQGTTLFQFILPLDRTHDKPPDDEPTTQPTTPPPAPTPTAPSTPPVFPTPRN